MKQEPKTSNPGDTREAAQPTPERHTAKRTAKAVFRSWWMSILATVTWSAAAFHAASSASIVVASYFTAWVTRMQHRLLLVFRTYGGQVLEDDAEKQEPTEAEITREQERSAGDPLVYDGWDVVRKSDEAKYGSRQHTDGCPHGEIRSKCTTCLSNDARPNLFGRDPPKGQA